MTDAVMERPRAWLAELEPACFERAEEVMEDLVRDASAQAGAAERDSRRLTRVFDLN